MTNIPPINQKDFKHILGHDRAKRALEIAAGGHNLLLSGPPGCGKSLLAETFPSILPHLSLDNQFEVLSLYQLAGQTYQRRPHAPFRTPHHSASAISLIGGGTNPKPGEVSLAHHGVLFLDEMAEFSKKTLDMLRQPIESGQVTISRVSSTVTHPALFILIGTMNPCPCGYAGSRHYYCTCSPNQIETYKNRLSGPIQDRIDILLDLEAVVLEQEQIEKNENSAAIQKRVIAARMRQHARYGKNGLNAIVSPELLLENSRLTEEQQRMMQQRASKNNWSTRVQMKIIRLAQTISDLAGEETISSEALWEAMTLRRSQVQQQRQRKAK